MIKSQPEPDPWADMLQLANSLQLYLLSEGSRRNKLEKIAEQVEQGFELFDQACRQRQELELAQFQDDVTRHPTESRAHENLAKTLRKYAKLDLAEAACLQALDLDPNNSSARCLLAGIYMARNRNGDAVEQSRLAVNRLANESTYYTLGDACRAAGDMDGAVASYRNAIRMQPTVRSYRELAFTLLWLGQTELAQEHFQQCLMCPRAPVDSRTPVTVARLIHDSEQIDYLLESKLIDPATREYGFFLRSVIQELQISGNVTILARAMEDRLVASHYDKTIFLGECKRLKRPAVSTNLPARKIEEEYFARGGVVSADDFLTTEALRSLRKYCLESTIWKSCFPGGYVGAFPETGFSPPLLFQIAEELRSILPGIFKNHQLLRVWAFKYDQRMVGISVHADPAVINVNFWITPESANLDPSKGGIIVWNKDAPDDWPHTDYNRNVLKIRQFLKGAGAASDKFAYGENRVVIFNSAFFHETDDIEFKGGYTNRRINVTLLFGQTSGLRHVGSY